MYHPDEIEEMEYQMNAEADYLNEAFGAEARELARQEILEWQHEQEEAYNALSGEEKVALEDRATRGLSGMFCDALYFQFNPLPF